MRSLRRTLQSGVVKFIGVPLLRWKSEHGTSPARQLSYGRQTSHAGRCLDIVCLEVESVMTHITVICHEYSLYNIQLLQSTTKKRHYIVDNYLVFDTCVDKYMIYHGDVKLIMVYLHGYLSVSSPVYLFIYMGYIYMGYIYLYTQLYMQYIYIWAISIYIPNYICYTCLFTYD